MGPHNKERKPVTMPISKSRTSKSHPLQIATIAVPGTDGVIGVTFCPGKKDPAAMTGAWDRDLETDVAAIGTWGASAVVCLMEQHELKLLKAEALAATVESAGIEWFHLPIVDVNVPTDAFERNWTVAGTKLRAILKEGGRILVHCRGGLGRSGTIGARLLVDCGMAPGQAIALVRQHRPGAIETKAQEEYVRKLTPAPAHTVHSGTSSTEDRAVGCLVGLALGDALGTTLEFSIRDSLPAVTDLVGGGPFGLKPGEWTDDTSMALCLADSLLERGHLDPQDLMERFRNWRDKGHNSVNGRCFDIGIATRQAISRYVSTGNPVAGSADPASAGNGSIMRLAPVPIFFAGDVTAAEKAAIQQSRTTHATPECLDACQLMTRILVRLIGGKPWEEAITVSGTDLEKPKVRELAARKWKGKKRSQIKSTGYVVDTLEAALWAVDTTTSWEEAVLLAVNLGEDADTVGAVTGQFAGARYGLKAIPGTWMTKLAWSDHLVELALKLHTTQMR